MRYLGTTIVFVIYTSFASFCIFLQLKFTYRFFHTNSKVLDVSNRLRRTLEQILQSHKWNYQIFGSRYCLHSCPLISILLLLHALLVYSLITPIEYAFAKKLENKNTKQSIKNTIWYLYGSRTVTVVRFLGWGDKKSARVYIWLRKNQQNEFMEKKPQTENVLRKKKHSK